MQVSFHICRSLFIYVRHAYHVTRVNEACSCLYLTPMWRDCMWVESLVHTRDMTSLCVTWLIRMTCPVDMTGVYVWQNSFTCVTWLNDTLSRPVHVQDMTRKHNSYADMTYAHISCMCVTWLIHVCDMTHSCVWQDSFMCVTWLIHVCDMTHSCVWHDSYT